ncbi:MAG: Spy/CpxP family protein refolding chaperone [Candidatus Melainabacteria bacterium]|nr:Spy/CpxP family protein refolding chaperone [Candidatus Melainabacteria bacterium]
MTRLVNFGLAAVMGASIFFCQSLPVAAQESDIPDLDTVIEVLVDSDSTEALLTQLPDPAEIAQAPAVEEIALAPMMTAAATQLDAAHMGKGKGDSCPVTGSCPRMGSMGKSWGIASVLEGDNAITDDQRESLYKLKNQLLDEIGPKCLAYASQKRALKDAMTQSELSEKSIQKMIDGIASLKSDMTRIKLSYKLKAAQVFTPEQRKALHMAMIKGCGHKHMHSGMMRMMMMRKMMGR